MPACHLAHRAVVRLSGADTRAFLQGLLAQDVMLLSADRPLYAGLLSPQGKLLFDLLLFADAADVLVDVAADRAEALVRRLTMFRLRKDVAIAADPALGVWHCWGEACDHPADPRHPQAGARYLSADTAAAGAADPAAWHAHRLALGLPESDEMGMDDLLWLETNARELNGVSFTKGCYTGQENTARMHHRGKVRKRLLPLSGGADASGPILAGGKQAGEWRGAAHGDWRMALLKMEYADQPLESDGRALTLGRPPWLKEDN